MTTNIAEQLNQQLQKSTIESLQGFFGDYLGNMKSQLQENRSALKELGQRFQGSPELQQRIQEIDQAFANVESSLDEAQNTVESQQGQQAQQAEGGQGEQGGDQAQKSIEGQVTQTLSETVNEAGNTVRRSIDDAGNIIESEMNESGEVVDEDIVGHVSNLQVQQEYTNESGQTVQRLVDESGNVIERTLDEAQKLLGINVLGQVSEQASQIEQQAQEQQPQEQQTQEQQTQEQEGEEEPEITNAARKKAEELGIDLSKIQGSGSGGRITTKDVQTAAQERG